MASGSSLWFRLVPQLVNKPAPKPVAEAAKAFGDNIRNSWRVPLLQSPGVFGNCLLLVVQSDRLEAYPTKSCGAKASTRKVRRRCSSPFHP